MNMTTARTLVTADQRESYPEMTEAEAVEHAANTIDPDALDDPDSELAQAYEMVIRAELAK